MALTASSKEARLRVGLLLGTVIAVNAAYTVLIPFVPELPARIHAGPVAVGLAFTLFAAGKLLAQPVGGVVVDRWGPRVVAVASLGLIAVGTVATALAGDAATLLLGRVVWGIGEGVLTPALYAGITFLCSTYHLPTTRLLGQFGSAANIGFLIGPLVTGLAGGLGFRTIFLLGAGLTVSSALALGWVLPTTPRTEPPEPAQAQPAEAATSSGRRWWVLVLVFGVLDLAGNLIYSALEPVLPLYLAGGSAGARSAVSLVFAVGLAVFVLSVWVIGRLGERVTLPRLVQIGLVVFVLAVSGLALGSGLGSVLVFFAIAMIGHSALYLAARRGVLAVRTGLAGRGRAFGLFGATSDLGNMIGPTLGTTLFGWVGALVFPLLAIPCAALFLGVRMMRTPIAPTEPVEPVHRENAR